MIKSPKLSLINATALLCFIVLFSACKTTDVPKGTGTDTPPKDTTTVKPVTHDWVVNTVAGSATAGFTDGDSTQAQFSNAQAIVADDNGSLFVGDIGNQSIRQVTYAGHVSTYAGKTLSSPDIGFGNIMSLARDAAGNIYTIEYDLIRKITSPTASSIFAGSLSVDVVDGTGTKAAFNLILNMAMDKSGNIYVPDYDKSDKSILRKVTPDGVVSTVALTDNTGVGDYSTPTLHYNHAITIDASGNIYTTGAGNCMIKKIDPSGNVTVFAGTPDMGLTDGKGTDARFATILGMTCDAAGNVYVTDSGNQAIRKITPDGTVSTIAGFGAMGYADGKGKDAQFKFPYGITVDSAGVLYVVDNGNNRVRRIEYK